MVDACLLAETKVPPWKGLLGPVPVWIFGLIFIIVCRRRCRVHRKI